VHSDVTLSEKEQ